MQMQKNGRFWNPPEISPFASDYSDQTGWFSPDGKRFYFGSVRPVEPDGEPEPDLRMWIVENTERGWSARARVQSFSQLIINHGPMYIPDAREQGYGGSDIYRIQFENGSYSDAVNLGRPVNSEAHDYPVPVGPKESYLVIYRTDRRDRAITGLYISFRKNNSWTEPVRMADNIGTGFDASLSPDGSALLFLKRNDGIFWVDARIIENMRAEGSR